MAHVFYEVTEPYSVRQMFALVNDVERYPDFVPDCIATGVLSKQEINQQNKMIKAFIKVEKLGFKKSFTTLNQIDEPNSIEMQLIEGPFKQLTGAWRFTELSPNSCKISFTLDFDFKNRLLDIAFTPIFKEIMSNMVNAFSRRAKQIYQ
ncbi:type II toxin-antitoxin system RatA family toxin [Orbaceae bacterium ESL0721]|nr:type II toxin-antitoxin system RatA family toxin [Orbaceae bacterium ESL0721]